MKQILQDQRQKLSVQSGTEKKSGFLLLTRPYLLPAKQVLAERGAVQLPWEYHAISLQL